MIPTPRLPGHESTPSSYRHLQTTAWCANGADFTHAAHRSLVLRVVFNAVERAGEASLPSVDWSIRCAADVELAEGVKLDVHGIVR
jgi:hypothetical protein